MYIYICICTYKRIGMAQVRQEYAAAATQLKGQAEEIEEAQRLLVDATQMMEVEQARRTAANESERAATQSASAAELDKRQFENKVCMKERQGGGGWGDGEWCAVYIYMYISIYICMYIYYIY